MLPYIQLGRDSSVGITPRYDIEGPGIESQWDEIFRTCPDYLWISPNILSNGYRVVPGSKAAGAYRCTSTSIVAPNWKRIELYISTPRLGLHGLFCGTMLVAMKFALRTSLNLWLGMVCLIFCSLSTLHVVRVIRSATFCSLWFKGILSCIEASDVGFLCFQCMIPTHFWECYLFRHAIAHNSRSYIIYRNLSRTILAVELWAELGLLLTYS
jgi:hypothetical protein